MEYKQVKIPKPLADRFDNISRYYGYRSFSEFVIDLVRDGISMLETKHDLAEYEKKRKDELEWKDELE